METKSLKSFFLSEKNKEALFSYINELNRAYKVFKYFIREEGDICLDSCIPSLAEEFNPEMIYTVLNLMLEHVMECYPTFMRKVWNEEK